MTNTLRFMIVAAIAMVTLFAVAVFFQAPAQAQEARVSICEVRANDDRDECIHRRNIALEHCRTEGCKIAVFFGKVEPEVAAACLLFGLGREDIFGAILHEPSDLEGFAICGDRGAKFLRR